MQGFIIFCLISATFAAPQYSYDQGGNGLAASAPEGDIAHGHASHLGPAAPAIYNKQIYIHSAPEDALDEGSAPAGSALSNQRTLRIVVIKAPENRALENAALQLAKSAGDQHTAIYVLNKQSDVGDLERKLSQSSNINANKPEVHFIKYKTPAEAEHAQHVIQAQYNSLPGPTSVSNEGAAPAQSLGGSAPSSGSASSAHDNSLYLPPVKRI